MQVGMLTAVAGEFSLNLQDAKRIMSSRDGLKWDFALNDGWIDPLYCTSQLVISKLERKGKKYRIEGSIFYNGKSRRFRGIATKCEKWVERLYKKTGLFECKFSFVQEAEPFTRSKKNILIKKALSLLRRSLKKTA